MNLFDTKKDETFGASTEAPTYHTWKKVSYTKKNVTLNTWIVLITWFEKGLFQRLHPWKLTCPKKRTILVGNTSSNHWFSGGMLVFRGLSFREFGVIMLILGGLLHTKVFFLSAQVHIWVRQSLQSSPWRIKIAMVQASYFLKWRWH